MRQALAVVALALVAAGPAAGADVTEKRIALVIGNARYPAIPLNNPENDARVVAATLRRLGFEVSEHVNLPVKQFRQVLRDYVRRLQNETGVGLLYYAGHGVQIDGKNYLLPVDINLRDEEEIKDEAVDIDDLFMSKLSRAKTSGLIIILDACRDNPFRTKTRNIQSGGGLAEMGAPGAFIAYAAAPGSTAEDGPERTNSVFTRHLAYEMLQPGVEIESTFKNVRVKVQRDTNKRQTPWSNSSLTIDFRFNPQRAIESEDAGKQAALKQLQETLARRDEEQRKLEEELQAVRRQLQKQAAIEKAPAAEKPDAPAVVMTPRATPSEVRKVDNSIAGTIEPSRPPDSVEPMQPAAPESAARKNAAPVKAAPREPRKPSPQVARSEPPATGKRAESERCVELQVRASLGEPVSNAELQKECQR